MHSIILNIFYFKGVGKREEVEVGCIIIIIEALVVLLQKKHQIQKGSPTLCGL